MRTLRCAGGRFAPHVLRLASRHALPPRCADASHPVVIASALVRKEDEPRSPWWPMLRKRVAQHNVRVVAKWYDTLSAGRLAQLLGLDAATTEAVVSELVSDKALYCKIDRPEGALLDDAGRVARTGEVGSQPTPPTP